MLSTTRWKRPELKASYRFVCLFPSSVANQPIRFDATDRDPLQAMAQVLAKVEAWRSGR